MNKSFETKPVATEREFLTLSAAAENIGCTRRFLETRIEDGELSVFRPSKRLVRIKRTEFDRWVEAFSGKKGAM
jgi:excisionase family DNA binding protein